MDKFLQVIWQGVNKDNTNSSYEGFPKSDIVVEAVVENTKLNKLYFEVRKHSDDCVLSSNTSTIEISELQSAKRPENFVVCTF